MADWASPEKKGPRDSGDFYNLQNVDDLDDRGDRGCLYTYAYFAVTTRSDQDELDHALGLSTDGVTFPGKNAYYWESEQNLYGLCLSDHVHLLLDWIGQPTEAWQAYRQKYRPKVTIGLHWIGMPGSEAPAPPSELPSRADAFGAKVEYDVDYDHGVHTCRSTNVELEVSRCDLDPEEISAFFGEPSFAQRAEDPPLDVLRRILEAHGVKDRSLEEPPLDILAEMFSTVEFGSWSLNSKGLIDSLDFEEHLAALMDEIGPPTREWRDYVRENDLDVKFVGFFDAPLGAIEPVPSRGLKARMRAYLADYEMVAYIDTENTGTFNPFD